MRQAVIDAKGKSALDDLLFREHEKRRMDSESAGSFNTGLGREVGEFFKGAEIVRAAIRIAAVLIRSS